MTTRPNRTFGPSPLRRIFCSLFFVAAVAAAIGAIASPRVANQQGAAVSSPPSAAQKIAPWVTEHTSNGQQAECLVVLADQTDLSPAAALNTTAKKGRFFHVALLNKAPPTQAAMLQWLQERLHDP